jgi:hypothetical protein
LRVTVRSTGAARLSVAVGRPPTGFAARPSRLDLAPGTSGSLLVSFRPRAARTFTARLLLAMNAPTTARVAVQLRGTGARR